VDLLIDLCDCCHAISAVKKMWTFFLIKIRGTVVIEKKLSQALASRASDKIRIRIVDSSELIRFFMYKTEEQT
jgi:hypothetical protein